MSNATNDPTVKPVAAVPAEQNQGSEEKQNFVTKTKQFVKTHKKATIAVAGLVGLVGLASVTGRRSEPLPGFQATLELEPPHAGFDVEVVEEPDTETA